MAKPPPTDPGLEERKIIRSIIAVREGNPERARELLATFVDSVDNRGSMTPALVQLLWYLRSAFHAYLVDGVSLETALGLKRLRGRPPADRERNGEIAKEVLRLRLKGDSLEVAT